MSEFLSRVVECISKTTRYPTELLAVDADIEVDLGIDSVKRVEIVIALGEEFGVNLVEQERDPAVRTIGDIANWVQRFVGDANSDENNSAPSYLTNGHNNGNGHSNGNGRSNGNGHSNGNGNHSSSILHNNGTSNRLDAPQVSAQPPMHTRPSFNQSPQPAWENANQLSQSQPEASLSPSSQPLKGRVALITGSGRGVGQVIARTLAAHGATVLVNSFHSRDQGDQTTQLIQNQGGQAEHLWGSVAKSEHVDQIFDHIEQRYGGLDILVCNASDGQIGSFMDLTAEDWDRAFRTNVIGHYMCAQRAVPLMRSRGGGSIITMSAIGAHHYVDGLGSQGVAKAAVESMTKYLACEVGQFGIRVNSVAAGPIYGDLISKFPDAAESRSRWESTSADGELTSPLDVARTISFLVGDDARGINGAVWTVDHGFSATAPGQHRTSSNQAAPASFSVAR
ncbi:SDR family oxidoreductase [Mariniblastus sp.]|nr:SDR family oxidoreductase [Mariniblastus sp.]